MKHSTKIILLIIAIALIPAIVKLQMGIDPQRKQFQPGKGISAMKVDVGNNPIVLPSQFIMGTLIGFREVVAGLLWVRVEDFFHSGQYEPIVPLIRIITWLDPHQIDIYCTGAWHLAYNFVDSHQRADFRYLAPAMIFLEEAIQNNPGVWDPEFDLGFVLYAMKAYDFDKSLYWIKKSSTEKNVPYHIYRQVAHAYEKVGMIDESIKQWHFCINQAKEEMKNSKINFTSNHYDVSKMNLDLLLVRKALRADLYKHPVDVGFEAEFKRVSPRIFIIKGKANLPDAAQIDVTLFDADYKKPNMKNFNWEVDPNTTAMVDIGLHGIRVEGGKFERRFDLSRDPKQYPLKKDKYKLTIGLNPRNVYMEVQDVVGWNGEGITDKKYLDTSIPGVRRIVKVIHLDRKDII